MKENELTLIVPTRNRLHYLRRCIAAAALLPCKVVIADNSTVFNSLPANIVLPTNVRFLHVPNASFSGKINAALNDISSPYIGLWADDDFYLPSALAAMLTFLASNTDYSAVHGKTLSFFTANQQVGYEKMYPQEDAIGAPEEVAELRVQKVFHPYLPLFYSIHREASFRLIFKAELTPENLNFTEFQIAFIAALNGKFACLPVLYHIREQALFSAGFVTKSLAEMQQTESGQASLHLFMEHLAGIVETQLPTATNNGLAIAEAAFNSYIAWAKSSQAVYRFGSYAWLKRNYIKPYFPKLFTALVKRKKQAGISLYTRSKLAIADYTNQSYINQELQAIEALILNYPI